MSTVNKGGYDSPANVSPVAPIRHAHIGNGAAQAATLSSRLSSDAILPHLSGQGEEAEEDEYPYDVHEHFNALAKMPDFDEDAGNPNLYFGEESSEPTNTNSYPFFYNKAREAATQNGINIRDSVALPTGTPDPSTGTWLDWNESFQTLLELPEDTKEQMLQKQEKLSFLAADFVYMAKRFSKIIISEAHLPNHQKTVKKRNVGGRAGGIKYIYNGILFKLQTDFADIYGGDFFAMKTGGLELKGVMRYYGCKGLHVPLMAVIDYRGFRVVAESILPITHDTLVYGSADGGNTIKDGADHEHLRDCMKEAAHVLNIDLHGVGKPSKSLYGPVDIEAHKGQDGRYYVIDFARVFPPTAEVGVSKTFLYKVMRPEFVKRYKKALSSDAYSPFVRGQKDEEEQNMKVLKATDFLLNVTVSKFASSLDETYLSVNLEDPLSNLTELIHREGINCRYLGLLRKRLSHDYPRELVLNEMIARVLKNNLRSELRQTMRRSPTLVEHVYHGVVLHFFNLILGIDDRSQSLWKEGLRLDIEEYFGEDVLDDVEEGESLRGHVKMWRLFKRLQQLTGVKLTQQALKELRENPNHFKLVSPDIKKMAVRVKHMNITYLAEATALAIQAMDYLEAASKTPTNGGSGHHHHHHDRLFELAMSKFEQAVRSTPDNTALLNHYAKVLEKMALMKAQAGEESYTYFEKAFERFYVARNHDGLLQLGDVLRTLKALWNEREKIFSLANKCYQAVTSADRVNSEALCKWGDLLVNFARVTGNDTTYTRAGSMYRSSITLRPMIEFEWIASWHHHLKDEELAVIVELLHTNKQESLDANKCFKKSFVTDNLVIQMATHIGASVKTVILDDCVVSDESIVKISKSCPNLECLSLKGCVPLSDNAFGHISNLTKLARVFISGCPKLTSFSFKFLITKLEEITHIDVARCQFKENFIGNLSSCASNKLRYINLSQQRFSAESWCRAISHMTLTQLEEILLDECIDITDQCISLLAQKAPHLKKVSLDSCVGLTDAAVFSLSQNCTQLRELFLSGCLGMTSRCLTYLGTFFTKLEFVAFERCPKMLDDLSGTVFFLSNNTHLTKLHLNGTAADDGLLEKLCLYCKDIADISLASTYVTSVGFKQMLPSAAGASKLRRVVLDNCSSIDDIAISALASSAAANLVELGVAGCGKLSDGSVGHLGRLCPSLQRLDLSNCVDINDVSIELIAKGCPDLTHLVLSECKLITDSSLEAVGAHLHNLRVLNVSHCLLISRVGPIAVGCPDLIELHMQCCEHLENTGMDKLAQLKFLRLLDIRECSHVKDGLVMALFDIRGCPALEELRLGRNKMEDTLIKRLQEARPKLRIEGVNYTRQTLTSPNPLNTSGSRSDINLRRVSSMTEDSVPGNSSGSTPASSISPSATALRALMHDLKEIVKNPLPLVSARPLESNMLRWHGNLLGPESTPFAGAVFHIQLTFPETYPSMPPSATIFTSLPHPHVHNGRICLDILSDFSNFFSKSSDGGGEVKSGWSSAYSVQTILLQLQTFLMELKAEEGESLAQFLQKIPAAIKEANSFSCSQCPHTPASPWPALSKDEDPVNPEVPKSEADVIHDELKCFHTRVSFSEDVLGVGISVKYHKRNDNKRKDIEELNSPLDLLSRHAFYDLGVRESVYLNHMQEKENFTHWLPLYINQEHGKSASELLRESLSLICTSQRDAFAPEMALSILPKLMNTMVVNVMSGRVHASIKALEGYCAMQRLLIYFVSQYPTIKETANRVVSNFAKNADYRTKVHVPSLGDFLALLSVTDLQWKSVGKAYIEESIVRNVRWVVQKYPELSEQQPNPQIDNNRSRKTLLASLVSIRLVMFHVYFLENVGRPPGKSLDQIADSYDRLYGRPNNVTKDHFLRAIKEIISIDDWADVFKWIGLECPEPSKFNEWLRHSITTSLKLGYHKAGGAGTLPSSGSGSSRGAGGFHSRQVSSPPQHSNNSSSSGGYNSYYYNRSPASPSPYHPVTSPTSTPPSTPPSPSASAASATSPSASQSLHYTPKKREVCRFWVESGGKECRFGNRCRYLHTLDHFHQGSSSSSGGGGGPNSSFRSNRTK